MDGNSNLRPPKGRGRDCYSPTNNGDDEGVDIDEKACKEDLLGFLEKMVSLKRDPEAGWEDEPEMKFERGRLVTAADDIVWLGYADDGVGTGWVRFLIRGVIWRYDVTADVAEHSYYIHRHNDGRALAYVKKRAFRSKREEG
jgi:hypothetical protein